MSIDERKQASVVVVAGRQRLEKVNFLVEEKAGQHNAVWILIQESELARWIAHSGNSWISGREVHTAAQQTVEAIATNPRHAIDRGLVSRAFIKRRVSVVGGKLGETRINQKSCVSIVIISTIKIYVAGDPPYHGDQTVRAHVVVERLGGIPDR